VLADRKTALDGYELIHLLERQRVNFMQGTPATWRLLLEAGWQGADHLKINCGGEAITADLAEKLLHKGSELWNLYGPTETTVWSATRKIENKLDLTSIGGTTHNTQIYILAENLRPAPLGVFGELYIGGDGVSRGYNNNPALTAERFVPDPLGAKPGARLYQTGDLGRLLPRGVIDLLGRRDNQVKVSGFRIELGAIEAALIQHPSVREAVVIARQEGDGEKRLVAYLILDSELDRPSASDVRLYLLSNLPEFMVPSAYTVLESYPLLPSGKIDRKCLPSPDTLADQVLSIDSAYVGPRNEVEEKLAAVWLAILNLDNVGVDDNFFELGGTSILAIKITAALHREGIEVAVSDLFQYPTIARIAEHVRLRPKIHQGQVTGHVPLTPYQLWALIANSGRTSGRAFWLAAGVRLAPRAVEATINRLREHHDALRLKLSQHIPSLIHETNPATSQFIECDFRNSTQAREELDELVVRSLSNLDFECGPVMSVALIHLPEGDGLLISTLDIVVDDYSLTIFIGDLARLYSRLVTRESPALPLKTESFKVWAESCAGLADRRDPSWVQSQLQTWGQQSAQPPFAIDYLQGALSQAEGLLREDQTALLLGTANHAYNTEPAELLLAGLATATATLFGGGQIPVVMDEDARAYLIPGLDVSRTVGCLRSLFAIRLESGNSNDLSSIIVHAKEGVRRAREIAPNDVFGLLGGSRSTGTTSTPLIEFRFESSRPTAPDGWTVFELKPRTAAHDGIESSLGTLKVMADLWDDRLRIIVRYHRDCYPTPLVERLITECLNATHRIIAHCESKERPEPTPSDFTYKDLSIDAINNLFD
jgi:hypothetical protein